MEPVLPASSVGASQEPSRTSPGSDNGATSSRKDETAADPALDAGFILEETDSEDSDVEEQVTARTVSKNDDLVSQGKASVREPFEDDDEIRAELGGSPDVNAKKEVTADETDTKEEPSIEEDLKEDKKPKKKARKLKKLTETRKAFDGRELVFVTECTQTDWKWKESTERTGKGSLLAPTSVKPESRQTVSQARTDDESLMDDRTGTDYTPFSLQPNDEFGIPMLDMSSDSDSSDNETPKKAKPQRHHLPTIGPPQILKYIRESDQLERDEGRGSSDVEDEHKYLDSADYILDENGQPVGMFNGPCEFCGDNIKLFPTLEQQLSEPPESLYCCEDYREFVEFAMSTASRLEEDMGKKNHKISVKVHGHHGSKQARKLAKEQAVQRMRERELARRQQEASGLQAAFYQYPRGRKAKRSRRKNSSVSKGQSSQSKDNSSQKGNMEEIDGYDEDFLSDDDSENMIAYALSNDMNDFYQSEDGEDDIFASDLLNKDAPQLTQGEGKSKKIEKSKKSKKSSKKSGSSGGGRVQDITSNADARAQLGLGPVTSHSSFLGLNPEVARQMKTINYQLSSQRCLEEGWTLRAPSPLDLDNPENEVFVPEPLHPAMIASGKLGGRKLVQKFYPDGTKFVTIFPDGTGNIFYPSGRLGILISSISLGKYTYVVQDDSDEGMILAVFEPNGNGCCYFNNGNVRVCYDQLGGTELDVTGSRKKVWSWRDQETHVHAPPFQPIVFGMNRYLGVRFMAQESIALTLTGRQRSCRFNVGSRLKLVAPELIPPKTVDEHFLFVSERKVRVETILDKVTNLLKFPKSPKVDRILPPLSVSAQQRKVDKMAQDYMASLPALGPPVGIGASHGNSAVIGGGGRSSRLPRKATKQRLSPLDLPSVSVN